MAVKLEERYNHAAVAQNGCALGCVSEDLRADREVECDCGAESLRA